MCKRRQRRSPPRTVYPSRRTGRRMSGTPLVAAVAGVLAAAALVDVLALARPAPAPRTRTGRARAARRAWDAASGAPAAPRDLDARLAAAGRPFGLRAADVMAAKGGAAMLALVLALPLGCGRCRAGCRCSRRSRCRSAAFLAPDAWLRRRARQRGAAMEAELPDLLDLLRVALGAGLSLDRAFAEVARRDRGLLAREWRTVAAQVELGVPREQALAELVVRCPCDGVATLAQRARARRSSRRSAAETLAALAREARAARARRMTERAARAAPQIQLVVALLLVPSVLLLVAAALTASLLS